MPPIRIFISSVQREFAQERNALRDFLQNDPLMRRFFDVFLFEDVPASDRRPDALYLEFGGQTRRTARVTARVTAIQSDKTACYRLDDQMIEYTLPEKPRSPRQKYQLTDKGRTKLSNLN